jgi:S-DNA-T family DNA segregation ATPase FtsK/SpoIIIE
MLAGLSVSGNPDNTKFMVMDFSPTGAEWSDILLKVAEKLPADFTGHTTKASDLAQVYLADLINVLDERKQLRGEQLMAVPSIFLLLVDADRVDELKRQTSNFDVSYSQAGEDLKRLLVEGPEKGIHLILSFSSIRKMESVLEVREALEHVQHRVALRMAENDLLRFGFVQSRRVAELQSADSEPICALYLDIESSKDVLFKPYIVDSSKATSITRDIEEIGQQLMRRSRTP